MSYHYAIINKETKLVEIIATGDEETIEVYEPYEAINIDFHDKTLFGKKYINGEFID